MKFRVIRSPWSRQIPAWRGENAYFFSPYSTYRSDLQCKFQVAPLPKLNLNLNPARSRLPPHYLKMPPPTDAPPTTEAIPPQTTDNANPFASNGTSDRAITGGPEWWRRSFAYMTNMGMGPGERAQFEADRGLKREQEQCVRCEKWRDYNLRYSSSSPLSPKSSPLTLFAHT